MGLQLPKRGQRVGARIGTAVMVSAGLLLLGACSAADKNQLKNLALPDRNATDRSPYTYDLWHGAWIAAILVGILVWGLILYAVFKFRRRSDDEIPVQTRYNLPIEILYTIAPVVMVVVFFFFTVQTQDKVLAAPAGGQAQHTIGVVGEKWSWSFNYLKESAVQDKNVYTAGTPEHIPTLVLPVNESVQVKLASPDVIHSFWVPAFLMKMDVIPGRHNTFSFTPKTTGHFAGKCAELCGTYHSRMLFNVRVVKRADYDAYLRRLEARGNVGIVQGAANALSQAGLPGSSQDTNQFGGQQ